MTVMTLSKFTARSTLVAYAYTINGETDTRSQDQWLFRLVVFCCYTSLGGITKVGFYMIDWFQNSKRSHLFTAILFPFAIDFNMPSITYQCLSELS